jgi:predicted nucleotidyltransferase
VRKFVLFGSLVRSKHGEAGDVDSGIEFQTKTFDAYRDLRFLLGRFLGGPIDLVIADAAKPRLRRSIPSEVVNVSGL